MDKKKIAENLRTLRGSRSLAQVAQDIGVTAPALSNYEQGLRIPRDEIKVRLAKYYGQSVESIFFS